MSSVSTLAPKIAWRAPRPAENTAEKPVVVAIFSTGVDSSHPDLKDSMFNDGVSFTGEPSSIDTNGHGTMGAGVTTGNAVLPGSGAPIETMKMRVLDPKKSPKVELGKEAAQRIERAWGLPSTTDASPKGSIPTSVASNQTEEIPHYIA